MKIEKIDDAIWCGSHDTSQIMRVQYKKINEMVDVINKQLRAYSDYVVATTHDRREFLDRLDKINSLLGSVRGVVDTLDKSDYET